MATHPEITDPVLRKIMANELLVMRRTAHRIGATIRDQSIAYNMLGFETALRRVNRAVTQDGFILSVGQQVALIYGDADLNVV